MQQHTQCLRKKLARKGLAKILKSKKGHNSVKIAIRVLGLYIQGQLMILNKYVSFKAIVSEKSPCMQIFNRQRRPRRRR